jgi:hypothetical protein
MLRIVGSVVAGYLVMALAIMVLFLLAYPMLGVDRLFAPGTYDAAPGWILLSFIVGFACAAAGGWVAARIAPGSGPRWLAGVVLVLGLIAAVPAAMNSDPARGGPRPDGTSMADAMAHARQPGWVALLNPLIGAVGVMVGAGKRRTS